MKNKVFSLLLISIFLPKCLCFAQNKSVDRFTLTHYTDENGLPQNSVKALAADAQGFIWLATEGGLVRFDGQRFYTFNKQKLAMPISRVFGFHLSLEGQSEMARNRPTFYTIINGKYAIKLQNSQPSLDSLYMAKRGNLPFVTLGKGDSYVSTGLPFNSHFYPKLAHYIILLPQGDGRCYVCHGQSIDYYDHWKKVYQVPFQTDRCWRFFTIGQTLYQYNPAGTLTRINRSGSTILPLRGAITEQASFDPGQVEVYWNHIANQTFLYSKKQLFSLSLSPNGQIQTHLLLKDFDLKQNGVGQILHEPCSKRLFLGSGIHGLFVFRPKLFQTLSVAATGNQDDNVLYAQLPFGPDRVLTPTGIVLGKDRLTGKLIQTRLASLKALSPQNDKYSLLRDQKGHIWLKQNHDLIELDATGQRSLRHWTFADLIVKIYQGPKEGPIWIGTQQGKIYQLDPRPLNPTPELVCKGLSAAVYYFANETPDVLLVGTEQGLYTLNIHFRQVRLIAGTQRLFIRSIYVPRPQEVWFTTYEDGFYLYHQGKLTHFPLDDNQYLATSHSIFEDKLGYFWIPTNKGLFQIARTDLMRYAQSPGNQRPYYYYYTKDQGFLTNEFNGGGQPGPVRLKNGYVSLPSLKGLVWFIPEQIRQPPFNKTILLDRVEVNDTSLNVRGRGDTLLLPLESQQLRLHLSTPYAGDSYNLHLAYRLTRNQAKPTAWIKLNPKDPMILFSTLGEGRYTLLIRKTNGLGTDKFSDKTIVLIVPPRWFETGWMQIGLVGMVLVLIYLFTRLRFRQISRHNQKLEGIVTSRTQDLQTTLIQLKASEEELSRQFHLQSRLMASITHDVQSPMQLIINATQQLHERLTHQDDKTTLELAQIAFETASRINQLLTKLLAYTRTKVIEHRKTSEPINLYSLVAEKQAFFTDILRHKQSVFLNELPHDFQIHSDSHLLGIILHNLIDNAIKHTGTGQIRVYLTHRNDQSHLVIANTGANLDIQLIQWFNGANQASQYMPNRLASTNRGMGLLIVKELALLIQVGLFAEQTETTNMHLVFSPA